MGRIIITKIVCDRCEKTMAHEIEGEWIWFDHREKAIL